MRQPDPKRVAIELPLDLGVAEHAVRLGPNAACVQRLAAERLPERQASCGRVINDDRSRGYPTQLGERLLPLWGMHQHPQADHDIERPIRERQGMNVTRQETDLPSQLRRPLARDAKHRLGSVHAGHRSALLCQEQCGSARAQSKTSTCFTSTFHDNPSNAFLVCAVTKRC